MTRNSGWPGFFVKRMADSCARKECANPSVLLWLKDWRGPNPNDPQSTMSSVASVYPLMLKEPETAVFKTVGVETNLETSNSSTKKKIVDLGLFGNMSLSEELLLWIEETKMAQGYFTSNMTSACFLAVICFSSESKLQHSNNECSAKLSHKWISIYMTYIQLTSQLLSGYP